jgi:GNAT superfamily N-acetyltransferase
MTAGPVLRAGRDSDAAGFIRLIAACWAEYPGCVMDLDGEVPELRALATYYARQNGALWAAEHQGRIVGMVATRPLGGGVWEICKMYADAGQRGTGLAQSLLAAAEAHARAHGATEMRLWSDTRFDRAHRFYEKCSYLRDGPIRALGDLSNSLEFEYAKPLTGILVKRLDAAAAVSAIPALAAISGTRAHWKATASQAATGAAILLAAWHHGTLAGSLALRLHPHRAEITHLAVAPAARRHGLARALLHEAETAAGRPLLTLVAEQDSALDRLCAAAGWTRAGTVPGYVMGEDGAVRAGVFHWKQGKGVLF